MKNDAVHLTNYANERHENTRASAQMMTHYFIRKVIMTGSKNTIIINNVGLAKRAGNNNIAPKVQYTHEFKHDCAMLTKLLDRLF